MSQEQTRFVDGTFDFSYGVDSNLVTTARSEANPNGLPRQGLAWGDNVTMRGGGVRQRDGWQPVPNQAGDGTLTLSGPEGLYNGGWMYTATDGVPYLIICISGRFLQVRVDVDNSVWDITSGLSFPPNEPLYHFAQGEQFLVIQAGDYKTLPAFWDGGTLIQSRGITGDTNPASSNRNQLPAAGPMVYYQQRIWYAYFREYTAGDIVLGAAGTAPYQNKDSILYVTENPLAFGGDGFSVPTEAGNIRALQYPTNVDATLGQGLLFAFTRKQVYGLDVPITRSAWIASDTNNMPTQRLVQRNNGASGDRSIVAVNGDLYYQSPDPAIRSLFTALRYFNQPGNTPISSNIDRAMDLNDRSLMRWSSGVEFNNRLLQCILPEQAPQGVIHKAIASMDFDPVSSISQRSNPIWEGIYEGLDILQLFTGDFGGRQRCFAVVVSRGDADGVGAGNIQLWELTTAERFENGDNRVKWYIETPAWTWNREFDLKKLDGGEIAIDRLYGTVDIKIEWRQDFDPCWKLWHFQRICTARSSCETLENPICYPLELFAESGKFPIVLPKPPFYPCDDINERPSNIAHQFQLRITIDGFCRIRGIIVYATPTTKEPYRRLKCPPSPIEPGITST